MLDDLVLVLGSSIYELCRSGFSKFKTATKGTKTAVLFAFVLVIVVASKLGSDGLVSYRKHKAEQEQLLKVQAEQRAALEKIARELREKVEKTTVVLNEALAAVQGSENPADWVSKFQDAWGHDIKIMKTGSREGWVVVSLGPDGELNTFDDIKREDSKFSLTGTLFGGEDEEVKTEIKTEVEPEPESASDEKEKPFWSSIFSKETESPSLPPQ